MQALADFAEKKPQIRARIIALIERLIKNGTPAMKSRGRKLLLRLNAR